LRGLRQLNSEDSLVLGTSQWTAHIITTTKRTLSSHISQHTVDNTSQAPARQTDRQAGTNAYCRLADVCIDKTAVTQKAFSESNQATSVHQFYSAEKVYYYFKQQVLY